MIIAEDSLILGGKLGLNTKERQVDLILKKIKNAEVILKPSQILGQIPYSRIIPWDTFIQVTYPTT